MTTPGTLTVHARPAWRSTNPYTAMLADAIERQGARVHDVGMARKSLPFNGNVLLLHWPDEFFKRPRDTKSLIAAWLRLLHLALAKLLRGLTIVWVAHNVRPHLDAPTRQPLRWSVFLKLVDGLITLSRDSLEEVSSAYPEVRSKPHLTIGHGHYMDRALAAPALPRAPDGGTVRLAALGAIRPNKRFAELARTVAASAQDVFLDMRGAPSSKVMAEEVRAAAAGCSRIALSLERMSDAELEEATDAADLIVLPYADILNSGVLFYALSRYRPVIAPRRGSIPEVRDGIGADWIYLFDGEFDDDALAQALGWYRSRSFATPPDLSSQDWDAIGAKVAAFLNDLAAGVATRSMTKTTASGATAASELSR